MNNNPLISVIVPVYNMEVFLKRCLDSIINQSYKNLEIICVDDGSSDNSPKICDEYATQDSRITVIHQENGGLSEARNTGLNASHGDYIAFVDSDDYILPQMYERLLEALVKNESDISCCFWQFESADGTMCVDIDNVSGVCKEGLISSVSFVETLTNSYYEIVVSVCNKLYKKSVFENIRFKGRYTEDDRILNSIYSKGYKIFVIHELLYVYCENRQSLTHQKFRKESFDILEILLERKRKFNKSKDINDFCMSRYCDLAMEYYCTAKKENLSSPVNLKKYVFPFGMKLFLRQKRNFKFLIRVIIFRLSPNFYYKKIEKHKVT